MTVVPSCPCDLCRTFVACPVNPDAVIEADVVGDVFDRDRSRAQVGPWAEREME